jgi:hypothetical protein
MYGENLETSIQIFQSLALEGLSVPDRLSQLPDHSVLTTTLQLPPSGVHESRQEDNHARYTDKTKSRFKVDTLPVNFMAPEQDDILHAIQRIDDNIREQGDIDSAYKDLRNMIFSEMEDKLPKLPCRPTGYGDAKPTKLRHKPWWNDDLHLMWNTVCHKEQQWLRH